MTRTQSPDAFVVHWLQTSLFQHIPKIKCFVFKGIVNTLIKLIEIALKNTDNSKKCTLSMDLTVRSNIDYSIFL